MLKIGVDAIDVYKRQISGFIYALPGHTPCFDITNINKKSIRQPGIHTIIDPEQIFFHLKMCIRDRVYPFPVLITIS